MAQTYVVTGTLTDGHTVRLDEALPAVEGKVRVTVEMIEARRPKQALNEYLADLRARHAARGHVPRSREDVDASVRAERENWD